MRIAIGSDHRGVQLKSTLVQHLESQGHALVDVGPSDDGRVDYPDFASPVARHVAAGEADRGILICGSGIGMGISANKVHGIRAAVCYDLKTAELSRQHNDCNVLCLSADLVEASQNETIVATWLTTEFEGGRHSQRVAKIGALEC